ncbi:MAG: 16S rRNA (cytidine(1402)-2'-O)-methyltransferase [bacterium]|nr:16S rRNA (cytidine(1402)-2'-O)-methyltransferase [bacterium]
MSEGRLYLVPTPVGNLEDITLRAKRVLEEADIVLAEDTRHSGRLLSHLGIKKPFMSFHEHNEERQVSRLLSELEAGQQMALISDAGTPGICDPGFRAVRAALEAGFAVEVLPGPTAFVPALVGSGLPCDSFVFAGYLPRKSGARRRELSDALTQSRSVVFYESPYRVAKSLACLAELEPERPVVVAREISKRFEEFWRGTAMELATALNEKKLKGEYVLVIGPCGATLPAKHLP